jgi:hypothetical protein
MQKKDAEIERLRQESVEREKCLITEKRERFIANELKKWRGKSWIWLSIVGALLLSGIVWIIILCNGNLLETEKFIDKLFQNKLIAIALSFISLIVEGFIVKSLYDKYQNHSNINAYKQNIKIPNELNPIE